MNDQILNDSELVYYVVRVNGINVTEKFSSIMLAEMEKQKLGLELRAVAEIVPVNNKGATLLLG